MTEPAPHRPVLRLTRRGRLVRTALVLLVVIALVLLLVSLVRGAGRSTEQQDGGTAAETAAPEHEETPAASDEGGGSTAEDDAPAAGPTGEEASGEEATPTDDAAEGTPEAESPEAGGDEEMVRSGTVGAGTWTIAAAAGDAPTEGVLRTYAVRVEDGIGVDAEEAAEEIAAVLADERGWQGPADVVFHRVADPAEAEFTISIGSPPTVDEMCLPARTGGLWSCRIGPEVAPNSDRWLHATPTYDDLAEYRAYMINHEVGHFLGHGHASCPAEGAPAPVMLQQSIDLQGCTPNAWPAGEEE